MITKTRVLMQVLFVMIFCLIASTMDAQTNQKGASKDLSYKLPVTRNGVTSTKVATTFWHGEYPQPVIDVSSKKTGKTTVQAYKSLKKLDAHVSCTIQNGIYNPWSKSNISVINYYTITSVEDYKALKTVKLDEYTVNAGDTITNVIYGSEGLCFGTLNGKTKIEFICHDVCEQPKIFQRLGDKVTGSPDEQWIYLKCEEGHKAFIQDSELLKAKGVKEGVIVKYGEVGPHGENEVSK